MGRKIQIVLVLSLCVLAVAGPSFAGQRDKRQKEEEKIVRLIKGKSLELTEIDGRPFRKAVEATFAHNGMTLACDTALWDVNNKMINAFGNVRLVQGEVTLTSDKLDYFIDDNLAQFRGSLVQLQDKKKNVLRTNNLDYNTKDSVAVFRGGGSMQSSDGQVMEGVEGTYYSDRKLFSFINRVNMYTDSVFIKSQHIDYRTDQKRAYFESDVDFWKDDDMLSSRWGWYDRPAEMFYFEGKVHALTKEQEAWCDSMYYYKAVNNVLMMGEVQMQDTTRNTIVVGRKVFYEDTLSCLTITDQAAAAIQTEHDNRTDTLFCGADTLVYWTLERKDIPKGEFDGAKSRLDDLYSDPIMTYRQNAAEERRKKEEEQRKALQEQGQLPGFNGKAFGEAPDKPGGEGLTAEPVTDTTSVSVSDTTSLSVTDTTSLSAAGSAAPVTAPVDSTQEFGFAIGIGNVRMFREDMQLRCDSLRYSDIDSVARFYKDPIIWNEGYKQYSADSLHALVKEGNVDRISMLSNARVITQEDTICYDQIFATEIMAYFNRESQLRRFDALGGCSSMFFLEEDGQLATVNKVDSKMMTAVLENGEVQTVSYYDSPKNDGLPLKGMKREDLYIKGFDWNPEDRPMRREDVTTLRLKKSERRKYAGREGPEFIYSEIYFPGYMVGVMERLELERREKARRRAESGSKQSQAAQSDTLVLQDTVAVESLGTAPEIIPSMPETIASLPDSLAASPDSLAASPDSLKAASDTLAPKAPPTAREIRAEQMRKAAEKREAEKQAHWDALNKRDAEKQAVKEEKKLKKKREKTRKALIRQEKQDARDAARLTRIVERLEKEKARKEARALKKNVL